MDESMNCWLVSFIHPFIHQISHQSITHTIFIEPKNSSKHNTRKQSLQRNNVKHKKNYIKRQEIETTKHILIIHSIKTQQFDIHICMHVCVCVCVCVCACVRACVRTRVCVRARARVSMKR